LRGGPNRGRLPPITPTAGPWWCPAAAGLDEVRRQANTHRDDRFTLSLRIPQGRLQARSRARHARFASPASSTRQRAPRALARTAGAVQSGLAEVAPGPTVLVERPPDAADDQRIATGRTEHPQRCFRGLPATGARARRARQSGAPAVSAAAGNRVDSGTPPAADGTARALRSRHHSAATTLDRRAPPKRHRPSFAERAGAYGQSRWSCFVACSTTANPKRGRRIRQAPRRGPRIFALGRPVEGHP